MRIPRWRFLTALLAASLAAAPLVQPAPAAQAAVLAGPNLAAGKAASASSSTQSYVASNVTDGNQSSYWESANNAFPQWVQVDLGSSVATNQVVLKLPTANWGARDETLAVQGSVDGQNFTDLSASAARTFSPPSNTLTVDYGTATTRYVRIRITGNTGWPAGQLSELEVYGPATTDTQAPTAPGSLAYTQPASGQIRLTWTASTDNVGVTGYDVYANNSLLTSVAGSVLTYTDTRPDSATVSYYVRAKDAAGNLSPNSNTVTRTGQSGDTVAPTTPGTLSYTQPGSGQIRLAWGASTDNVGVTAYDIYVNGALRTSVGGSTLTYTDSQPDSATVADYVKARDAAGNVSAASNTVTRTATTTPGGNLAVGKPIEASSTVYTFVATNANDNDTSTYWEGSAYPANLT